MNHFSDLKRWISIRSLLGVSSSILLISGLCGAWIWQPRPLRRAHEIGMIYEISPLRALIIEKGELITTYWFFNFKLSKGISLSLLGLILGAILSFISLGRWKISLTGFMIYFASFLLFFYSLGQGLSIGLWSLIGWGLQITIVAGILLLTSTIINYIYEEVE